MNRWKGTLCMSGAMFFSIGLMGGPVLPAYGAVSMEPAIGPPLLAEKPPLGPDRRRIRAARESVTRAPRRSAPGSCTGSGPCGRGGLPLRAQRGRLGP